MSFRVEDGIRGGFFKVFDKGSFGGLGPLTQVGSISRRRQPQSMNFWASSSLRKSRSLSNSKQKAAKPNKNASTVFDVSRAIFLTSSALAKEF